MRDTDFSLVEAHLLRARDREVRKVLGFGKREIESQIIRDLYSLPGTGGSDERHLAHEWLTRSGALFPSHEIWQKRSSAFWTFEVPTIQEMEVIAKELRARLPDRYR